MSGRAPRSTAPARIEPLATLPVFLKLQGRPVVLAGDSDGAVWKAELLAAAGAEVRVFAPDAPERFAELSAMPPAGVVLVTARRWMPADLDGAVIAIADLEDEAECHAFAAAARAAGAAVNIIDKPAFCGFQFGGIVNRSPLVIGISTDGAAPVFGQAVRAKIEAILPRGLTAWAQAARAWRPFVQARELGFRARRLFWERFTSHALARPTSRPTDADRDALLADLDRLEAAGGAGRVTLIGAGPGDPDLLTLKAVRALQSADVILYDDLVSPEVLDLARREAKRMLVGKSGYRPSCRQDEINALMVRLALEGRHVARLKSGDPAIFGRASEELAACRDAGIAVEIVPGITAAQGMAAALGFSLTQRLTARRVQYVTAHAQDGKLPADLNWAALADPAATTIVYMPRRRWDELAAGILAAGLSPDMPALAVMSVTRPDQQWLLGTLVTLGGQLAALPEDGPMLIVIGAVAAEVEANPDTVARGPTVAAGDSGGQAA